VYLSSLFFQPNELWFLNIVFACFGILVVMTTFLVSYRSMYMLLKSFSRMVVS
jgi:hypothetical protein